MTNRWIRSALVLSFVWAVILSVIAAYEAMAVDPWSFIGEDRGPMFFAWAPHVIEEGTAFGDPELVFDPLVFWAVVLIPSAVLVALAATLSRLERLIRRQRAYR